MSKYLLFITKQSLLAFALLFISSEFTPNSYALEEWELDRLQGKFGSDIIYGGKNNIWNVSATAHYTVGIGPDDDILCTATLISRNVLLTAGHCFRTPAIKLISKDISHAHFIKRAPKNSPQKGALLRKSIKIRKVIIHPKWEKFIDNWVAQENANPYFNSMNAVQSEYVSQAVKNGYIQNGHNWYNDITLLILDRDAPAEFKIASLPVPKAALKIKQECNYAVTGFGVDNTMSPEAKDDFRDSKSGFVNSSSIKKKRIGLTIKGSLASCEGDSGGPLLEFCSNRVSVVGISSHQDPFDSTGPCESGGSASNYTYVTPHMEWILSILKKAAGEQNL